MRKKNLSGLKFGRLTALKESSKRKQGQVCWVCRCKCENIIVVQSGNLASGNTKSCGCSRVKHGSCNLPEYNVWKSMVFRCSNPNYEKYSSYGGRGIKVCERWKGSFVNFIKDMGLRPSSNLSIERIDNNKGYSPENCKWATSEEQMNNRRNNRRITINRKTKTLTQWCNFYGLNYQTVQARLRCGDYYSMEEVFK